MGVSSSAEHVFSASQLETFLSCKRKWGWSYIAKIPRAAGKGATLGGSCHKQLERYLTGGAIDYELEDGSGEIVTVALPEIPAPNTPGMEIERYFTLEGRHKYRGYKDVEIVPGGLHTYPVVMDHKTTSDFRYALTAEDLATNIQAVIYAVDACRTYGADAVDLQWTYILTRGASKVRPVKLRMYAADAEKVFSEIELLADEANTLLLADTTQHGGDPAEYVRTIPPSPDHCEAYGGCPYRDLCNLSPKERMRSIMSNAPNTSSMLARLKARAAGEVTEAPAPVVAALVAVQEGITYAPSWDQASNAPIAEVPDRVTYDIPVIARPAINPPEFQPPPVAELEQPAAAPVAKKRGRPAKVQPAAAHEVIMYIPEPSKVDTIPAPPVAEGPSDAQNLEFPVTRKVGLYINCLPLGLPATMAEAFIEKARQEIQTSHGLADYRFAEYGQGPGMLARKVVELVLAAEDVAAIMIDTRTPEGAAIAAPLSAHAAWIVRGAS